MKIFLTNSKQLLKIALPLLSSRLVNTLTGFFATLMIAKFSQQALAATALGLMSFWTIIMVGIGILFATSIKISHEIGAGNIHTINHYFQASLLLGGICGAISILLLLLITHLLSYLGQDPQIIPMTQHLMYSLGIAIFPIYFLVILNQMATGAGKTKIILITSIIEFPLMLLLYYAFIFGHLGMPKLGVWGIGVGSAIADTILSIFTWYYLKYNYHFKKFIFNFHFAKLKILWPKLREIVQLGMPIGIQFGSEIFLVTVSNFILGTFGPKALIARQISSQFVMIAIMLAFTLAESAAVCISKAIGEKKTMEIRHYGNHSAILSVILVLPLTVIMLLFPKFLISFYININDPTMINTLILSKIFILLASISILFDAIRDTVSGALRGLHDSKSPMYISIVMMGLIYLPLGTLLAFKTKLQASGFPVAFLIAVFFGAIITISWFYRKIKYFEYNDDKIRIITYNV